MTSHKQIQRRIARAGTLLPAWQTKIVGLRRMVIGDYSQVEENSTPQLDWGIGQERQNQRGKRLQQCYEVMMQDFETGLPNGILESIRTIATKSAYSMPAFEAEGVHDVEAAIIALYLGVRLGEAPRGCNAVSHMRRSLLHFLIDGVGTVWNTMQDGKPLCQHVDNLDVTFDVDATLWADHRWRGCYVRRTLGEWIDEFGEAPFDDLLENSVVDKDDATDKTVELHFYFDTSGFDGTYHVARADRLHDDESEPILHSENPHFHKIDGYRQPVQPIDMMMFMELPQAPMPIGVVEMALPHEIAHRLYTRVAQITAMRSTPFWWAEEGAMDEDALEQFERGEPEALVTGQKGAAPPVRINPGETSRTITMLIDQQKAALTSMMGSNPYSNGGRVEGIAYASEVQAIQANAGLVEGSTQLEHVSQWQRSAKMTLWNGMIYDTSPLSLNLDGDLMRFGPDNPVGQYLRGDADLVIADDSTAYASRGQRIMDAKSFVDFAVQVAPIAPGAIQMAVEKALRAYGVRNVAKAFQPMVGMGGQTGNDEQGLGADAAVAASAQ